MGLLNGYVDFDNHGSRFTGEHRIGANLNVNNPLTIGDQLTVRGFTSDDQMNFGRVAYLVPVGFWGTRLGASVSKFDYELGEDFAALGANGDGLVKSVYAFHPLYRTRNSNVIGQIAYEDKRLHDRIDNPDIATSESRFIDSLKVGGVGDFRDGFLGGGLNAFSLTYTQGDLKIEPTAVAQADAGPTGLKTAGTFRKWNYDYKRRTAITDNASVLSHSRGSSFEKPRLGRENVARRPERVRAYRSASERRHRHLITGELRYLVRAARSSRATYNVLASMTGAGLHQRKPRATIRRTSARSRATASAHRRQGGEFIVRANAHGSRPRAGAGRPRNAAARVGPGGEMV